jgi:hypothetical protein
MRGFIDVLLVAAFLFPSSIPYRVAAISIPYLYINDPNIQSHNSSDLEISNLDHTTVPDSIDPFFGCVPSFKGPKLNENSALLISLDAALQLALEDLDALLGETVYKLDSHPEVQIIIRPDRFLRHGKLPQRFAVWGLNIAIDLMIQTRNFQSATFLLTYSGRALATIEFSVTEGRDGVPARLWNVTQDVISLVQPYNRTTWLDIVDPNTNITKTDVIASRRDPSLHVNFHLSGLVLSKYDICNAALNGLRQLSNYRRTERISNGTFFIPAAELEVVSVDANNPPRTSSRPPYYQAQWMMRALAQMPVFMLGLGEFKEVGMDIVVGKTLVGWVYVKRIETAVRSAYTA